MLMAEPELGGNVDKSSRGHSHAMYCLYGGGSVRFWAGIHCGGPTNQVILHQNVNAESYVRLLETHAVSYARRYFGRNVLRQHDNAPTHRARRTQQYLEQEEIEQLPWSVFSPDLNPIEHAWNALCMAVKKGLIRPINLRQLEDALFQEWVAFGQRDLNKGP